MPLTVRSRSEARSASDAGDRVLAALNPQHAVVPGEVDPVVGGETGEEVAARVNGPMKPGRKGDGIAH